MQIIGSSDNVSRTIHSKISRARSRISSADVAALAQWASEVRVTPRGRADVRKRLALIDQNASFTARARRHFQDLLAKLALKTGRPITLPLNELPFWQRAANPLANYQSSTVLPSAADVVIIGAGLTGASAAYHLRRSNLKVDRENCKRILRTESDTAAKFLGALHEGLIDALHNSDLRLMQLERQFLTQAM